MLTKAKVSSSREKQNIQEKIYRKKSDNNKSPKNNKESSLSTERFKRKVGNISSLSKKLKRVPMNQKQAKPGVLFSPKNYLCKRTSSLKELKIKKAKDEGRGSNKLKECSPVKNDNSFNKMKKQGVMSSSLGFKTKILNKLFPPTKSGPIDEKDKVIDALLKWKKKQETTNKKQRKFSSNV